MPIGTRIRTETKTYHCAPSSHFTSFINVLTSNDSFLSNNLSHITKPLCSIRQRVSGDWQDRGKESVDVNPPCCGFDKRRRLVSEGNQTKPVCVGGTDIFRGSSDFLIPAGGFGCKCSEERMRDMVKYEWVPHKCTLPVWDAQVFCDALGSRTILFIGDSTSTQIAATIHNYISWNCGTCGNQIISEKSDTLTGNNYGVLNRGRPWDVIVENMDRKPDIVILGASPHVSYDYGTRGMIEILEYVRTKFESKIQMLPVRVVWRTSLGAGCLLKGADLKPLPSMPSNIPGYWNNLNRTQKIYNFELMEMWDTMALNLWRNHSISILDLTPLWMRPDVMQGSGDSAPWNCAHTCMPGALRMAARQLLLLLRTELRN